MMRVGIIGYGRIAKRVAAHLGSASTIASVLIRGGSEIADVPTTTSLDQFLAARPDVVLEAASVSALIACGPSVLAAGIDLLPLSLCALIDERFYGALRAASGSPGAGCVLSVAGAIGGLDGLVAAREADLQRVIYRTAKPISVWRRTAAARMADLDAVTSETTILRGSVRELAAAFPHNLNVAVGVALAGLGLDRTEVELVADPALAVTVHELEFWAKPGHARLRLVGTDPDPLVDCADYTAFSVLHALRTRSAPVVL